VFASHASHRVEGKGYSFVQARSGLGLACVTGCFID